MKSLNAGTYVESFGTTFANGRPGRPGTYPVNCNWPTSCRKGCGYDNTVQQGVYSMGCGNTVLQGAYGTGCGNSVLSVSVSSCGCGKTIGGSGCTSRCRPLPPCPGCFDGCTQIYCDDKGCRVVGHSSYSMNQCHGFDPCFPHRWGRPPFAGRCCRPLPPCPPVCRPLPPCPPPCRPLRPCRPFWFDDCRPPFRPPFRPFPGYRPGPLPGPRPYEESDEYWESYEYGEAED